MAGLTKWVRPPLPWRPSKLRLEVDAQRSCGSRRSAFMAKHIEQPGSRHSKPAAVNTLSSPSCSACSFTKPEPGTTSTRFTLAALRRPLATAAASRKSSMRLLVHEPINTTSTAISFKGVSACKPMYSSARSMPPRLTGSASWAGLGTWPLMLSTISGDVPQVTCGSISAALNSNTLSNAAPSSETKVRQ